MHECKQPKDAVKLPDLKISETCPKKLSIELFSL